MTWYAQAGQDEWVHGLHPEPGYFVDVGAHDGVTHSNTYALEQNGWKGLCLEPNREAFRTLCWNRTATCRPWAASSDYGYAGFDGTRVLPEPTHPLVPMAPLRTALEDVGAPTVIDYLSIDVEGHELQVLAGMDFDRWHVELITIEHNLYSDGAARKDAIHQHLIHNGFVRVAEDVVAPGYGPYEDWYRHYDDLA